MFAYSVRYKGRLDKAYPYRNFSSYLILKDNIVSPFSYTILGLLIGSFAILMLIFFCSAIYILARHILKIEVYDGIGLTVLVIFLLLSLGLGIGSGYVAISWLNKGNKMEEQKQKEYATQQWDKCFVTKEAKACYSLCNRSVSKACKQLFDVAYQAEKNENYPLATEFYHYGCRANRSASCNNLGVMYENGRGVIKSIDRATELYKKACKLGSKKLGCTNAGLIIYKSNQDISPNQEKVTAFLTIGCQAGNNQACDTLSEIHAK